MSCFHARRIFLYFHCLSIQKNLYFSVVECYKRLQSKMSQNLKYLDKCTISISRVFSQISYHYALSSFQRINLRMQQTHALGQHESANINYKCHLYHKYNRIYKYLNNKTIHALDHIFFIIILNFYFLLNKYLKNILLI